MGFSGDDAFEEGARLGRLFAAEQALAEMGAGVDVLGVAFEGGAVAGLGLFQFALLEIEVAKLEVMMGVIEVMDLGLELLDAAAVEGARQFETARRRGGGPIDGEVVEERRDTPADEDEEGPEPFPAADGVNEHP